MKRGAGLLLLLFALLTAAAAWQARDFRIDASADTLLDEANAHYLRSRIIGQRFAPQEFVLLAYAPREHALYSARSFATLSELDRRLSELERVESVRSLVSVPLLQLGGVGLDAQADYAGMTVRQQGYSPAQVQRVMQGHPIYEGLLVNAQGTATALQVLFRPEPELAELEGRIVAIEAQRLDGELNAEQRAELAELQARAAPLRRALDRQRYAEIAQIRAIAADYEDEADLVLGGAHVLGQQLIEIIRADLLVFGAAIAAVIALLLLLVFRSLRWVLIPLLCCGVSLTLTLGLFAALGFAATVISANFVALQLILTLALVVHLIVQYREERRARPEAGQPELVRATLRAKTAPVLYAGLTTSVGFASLLLSGIEPVVAFGWMMVVAMAVSIATGLLLFPALMLLGRPEPARREARWAGWLLGGLARSARAPALWLLLTLAWLAAAGLGAQRLSVENSFIDYFRADTQVHKELRFIDRELGGTTPLDIVYTVPESERHPDLVLRAQTIQRLQRLHARLAEHEAMGHVLSVVNVTELARTLNAGKPLTEYELTAIYWLLDDTLREKLVGSFYAEDAQQIRISARVADTTPGLNRAQLLADIRADLREVGIEESQVSLSNLFVLYQDLLQRLYRSQILTLGVVFAVLALAFALIFRSPRRALIALLPNLVATGGVLGLMGWAGIPLDFMTMTIAAIAMGIAVDDTIHYLHRYRAEARRVGPRAAVAATHHSVGHALLYTTLILACGFALLLASDFLPSVYFGLLTALALLLALLADLTLLPALLARWGGFSGSEPGNRSRCRPAPAGSDPGSS